MTYKIRTERRDNEKNRKISQVSLEQFKKDWIDTFGLDEEANMKRFTKLSNCREEQPQDLQDTISLHRCV